MEKKLRQNNNSCIKVVLIGPESTGKTTLAKQLAEHYGTLWVPEFSRRYAEDKLEQNCELTKYDVLPIAIGQMKLENKYSEKTTDILFCDTNLLETKIYSEYLYNGYCPNSVNEFAESNTYDLHILTATDMPWEMDPVRGVTDKRNEMFVEFKTTLDAMKLPYIIVFGDKETRLLKAIKYIDVLLKD
jgi:NadR type nicotinamide-nucleotide adenylyltransferase